MTRRAVSLTAFAVVAALAKGADAALDDLVRDRAGG
jgi:hypothetical protein